MGYLIQWSHKDVQKKCEKSSPEASCKAGVQGQTSPHINIETIEEGGEPLKNNAYYSQSTEVVQKDAMIDSI